MHRISVVLPAWTVESGEVRLAVGELWRPALVASPVRELMPATPASQIDGMTDQDVPAPEDGPSRRPEFGWVASSVATVPVEQRVEYGRMVGHLPLTAFDAGGIRFAVEGTYEGRWGCSACTFEHLPQVLDESSPIFAATAMSFRVERIIRFAHVGRGPPVEVSHTGNPRLEEVNQFVAAVRT